MQQKNKQVWLVLLLYIVFAVAASVGQFLKSKPEDPISRYNNYLIFKSSFQYLRNHVNMYSEHPEAYYDLYKYSPSFAVMFAPFSLLNDHAGLITWNLLNALSLFLAVWLLPGISENKKIFILLFVLIELMTNMQNSQSNGLVAALLIGAFISFEKQQNVIAALLILLSVYIKLFGLLMAVMFLFYKKRMQFIVWAAIWAVLIFLLPLVFTSFDGLQMQLEGWVEMLKNDHSLSEGISLFGILGSWFGLHHVKIFILAAGLALLMISLWLSRYKATFEVRTWYFASLLIWLVIFNHKAESPTYIIAASGAAIWFFQKPKPILAEKVLIALTLILTILSPTDLFPREIRNSWVVPYSLKALPCILIYFKITYDLLKPVKLSKLKGLKIF
ncbi:MAG: DUF2029 domain-containing protein [Bacteroidia bacterium]|nr:DUF2029 domain-containing protein [Bacteroidia bacterium]MCZ2276672.1 DUF2029 domain-containing protein [Bacteroidia bacterium]